MHLKSHEQPRRFMLSLMGILFYPVSTFQYVLQNGLKPSPNAPLTTPTPTLPVQIARRAPFTFSDIFPTGIPDATSYPDQINVAGILTLPVIIGIGILVLTGLVSLIAALCFIRKRKRAGRRNRVPTGVNMAGWPQPHAPTPQAQGRGGYVPLQGNGSAPDVNHSHTPSTDLYVGQTASLYPPQPHNIVNPRDNYTGATTYGQNIIPTPHTNPSVTSQPPDSHRPKSDPPPYSFDS